MKIDQWLNGWDEDPDFDSPLFDLMWNELIENQKIEKVGNQSFHEFFTI